MVWHAKEPPSSMRSSPKNCAFGREAAPKKKATLGMRGDADAASPASSALKLKREPAGELPFLSRMSGFLCQPSPHTPKWSFAPPKELELTLVIHGEGPYPPTTRLRSVAHLSQPVYGKTPIPSTQPLWEGLKMTDALLPWTQATRHPRSHGLPQNKLFPSSSDWVQNRSDWVQNLRWLPRLKEVPLAFETVPCSKRISKMGFGFPLDCKTTKQRFPKKHRALQLNITWAGLLSDLEPSKEMSSFPS